LEILSATYMGSFPTLAKCPEARLPEFAFIGRSNVGKSSLINMLCGKKKLAHVSKKPGKTQAINFYLINENWSLVDLPGYGYAVRSKSERKSFGDMITDYLLHRQTLQCAFVLIDSNVPPQDSDLKFINWMGENEVPFVIGFTKSDKLKTQKQRTNIGIIQNALKEHWNELPQQFITSSVYSHGKKEILTFIDDVNKAKV
jgi:GTP-binding protein